MITTLPQAVLFDLDGTLIDTADEFVVVVQALRGEHQLPPMDPARIRATVSNGARALVTLALELAETATGFEDRRQRLLALYVEVVGTTARPYPGIEDLLQELNARDIAWGIATNKPRRYTELLLQRLALAHPPGSVVCADDVPHSKPDPAALLRNCRELGCPPAAAVYVGDHQRDIEAGRRAGIPTIAALYGYIEPDDDPHTWGADASVMDSTELQELILGIRERRL